MVWDMKKLSITLTEADDIKLLKKLQSDIREKFGKQSYASIIRLALRKFAEEK